MWAHRHTIAAQRASVRTRRCPQHASLIGWSATRQGTLHGRLHSSSDVVPVNCILQYSLTQALPTAERQRPSTSIAAPLRCHSLLRRWIFSVTSTLTSHRVHCDLPSPSFRCRFDGLKRSFASRPTRLSRSRTFAQGQSTAPRA